MNAIHKRWIVALGLLMMASLLVAQTLPRTLNFNNRLRSELVAASKRAGVEIDVAQMVSLLRNRSALLIAPIRGFERVGAVDLPNGADIAFAFVRSQSGLVPTGFYTLRGYVDDVRLGFVPARIQFIDELGQVAAEIPARVEIHSLTVPRRDPLKRVVIMVTTAMQGHFKTEGDDVWIFCSNGQSWHYIEVAEN